VTRREARGGCIVTSLRDWMENLQMCVVFGQRAGGFGGRRFLEGASRVSDLGLGADLGVYAIGSVEGREYKCRVFPQSRMKALLEILEMAVGIVAQTHVHLIVRPSTGDAEGPI